MENVYRYDEPSALKCLTFNAINKQKNEKN
jgi:hypothetical protein